MTTNLVYDCRDEETLQNIKALIAKKNPNKHCSEKISYFCKSCGKLSTRRICNFTDGSCHSCHLKEVWAKKSHEEKRIIQQHQQDAIKEKYGVENVFAASWCKEKIKQTNIEKYGENYKSVFAKKQLETIEKKHGKKRIIFLQRIL